MHLLYSCILVLFQGLFWGTSTIVGQFEDQLYSMLKPSSYWAGLAAAGVLSSVMNRRTNGPDPYKQDHTEFLIHKHLNHLYLNHDSCSTVSAIFLNSSFVCTKTRATKSIGSKWSWSVGFWHKSWNLQSVTHELIWWASSRHFLNTVFECASWSNKIVGVMLNTLQSSQSIPLSTAQSCTPTNVLMLPTKVDESGTPRDLFNVNWHPTPCRKQIE